MVDSWHFPILGDRVFSMLPATTARLIACVCTVLATCATVDGQCGSWLNELGTPPGVNQSSSGVLPTVRASCFWDSDGEGPQEPRLYIGGTFSMSGGRRLNGIAYWEGNEWHEIPNGNFDGVSGRVSALTVWDPDGSGPLGDQLIVGGQFGISGITGTTNLARWDGTSWHAIGTGITGGTGAEVLALTTWDPDGDGPAMRELVAGGIFSSAGSATALNIARRGTNWSAFGTGTNGAVQGLTTWDPDGPGPLNEQVVACGTFSTAGGVTVNGVSRWDGAAWRSLGGGVNAPQTINVTCVLTRDWDGDGPLPPRIVVGGSFTRIGGVDCARIASWNGSTWLPFETGLDGTPLCLATTVSGANGQMASDLFVGGSETLLDGDPDRPSCVARWDGASWIPQGNGIAGDVRTIAATIRADAENADQQIVIGGYFPSTPPTTGQHRAKLQHIARLDGGMWRPFGGGLASTTNDATAVSHVVTLDPDDYGPEAPQLYVTGAFGSANGEFVEQFATFRNGTWHQVGTPHFDPVTLLSTWDVDGAGPLPKSLISAGYYVAGPISIFVSRLENDQWTNIGNSFDDYVYAATTWDGPQSTLETPELVVGGEFRRSAGTTLNAVARWDGTAWQSLGTGLAGACFALLRWDSHSTGERTSRIVAAGAFSGSGSIPISNVATWDGESWSGFNGAFNGPVYSMVLWDPDGPDELSERLVVAGSFSAIDGVAIARVAWWDGANWQPFGAGLNSTVLGLTTWDPDGSGPEYSQLVAVGRFGSLGGLPRKVGIWNGVEWQMPGLGVSVLGDRPGNPVECAVSWDPDGMGPELDRLVVGGAILYAGESTAAAIASWVSCSPPECAGDFSGDRVIDVADLAILLTNFGTLAGPGVVGGDIDEDRDVDLTDLSLLLRVFGNPCP